MHRCTYASLMMLSLTIIAGCSDGSSTAPGAANSAALSDPAAQVANEYLNAAVKGDTARAVGLYTPQAAEKMKQFPLPGIADYTFRITGVAHPSSDKALVECRATSVSPGGESVEEDLCLLLASVNDQWRVSGMAFNPDPTQPPMIFSFEAPDRGPIPIQQWLAEATAGGNVRPSPPRTAQEQEVIPAGGYR
jgi:hypothetical protein